MISLTYIEEPLISYMLTKSEKPKIENYSSLEVKLGKSTDSFAPSLQKVNSIGLRQQCEILLWEFVQLLKICSRYPLWTILDSCHQHLSSKFSSLNLQYALRNTKMLLIAISVLRKVLLHPKHSAKSWVKYKKSTHNKKVLQRNKQKPN